jgi:hypothetical protein
LGCRLQEMIAQRIFLKVIVFMISGTLFGSAADKKGLIAQAENQIGIAVSKETRSESRIRDHVLKLTPIGSTPAETIRVIAKKFPDSIVPAFKKNFYTSSPAPPYDLIYVEGCVGINTEDRGWFGLFSTTYQIVWYFDQADDLFNVTVKEILLGP